MSRQVEMIRRADARCIPIAVSIEITHRCNFRCSHCFIPDFTASDGVATDRWLQLLDELVEAGTLYLAITGGEPLMRKDWRQILRRARSLGFDLRLFTNAVRVDAEIAAELAELYVLVEVSLHSLEPSVFESTTGVQGSFDRTFAGIEKLRAAGARLKLKMPVTGHNVKDVPSVAAFARSIGAEFQSDPRIVFAKNGDPGPTANRLPHAELVSYYRSADSSFTSPVRCPAPMDGCDGRPCAVGSRTCTITASGDVVGCPVMPEVAGNINRLPFLEIWHDSPWFRELRSIRRTDLRVCGSCSKLAYCNRCPAQALVEDGDLRGPARWSCELAQTLDRAFDTSDT